jgi:hypothetical protein
MSARGEMPLTVVESFLGGWFEGKTDIFVHIDDIRSV